MSSVAGDMEARPGVDAATNTLQNHQGSVPATPIGHIRSSSFTARSPSPPKRAQNGSPKSSHSQITNGTRTRAKAPSFTGCRFETGMAFSRRRIPYSIGGDQLERSKAMPKKFLSPEEDEKLSGDMRELYDRILPSNDSNGRRAEFIKKLDHMLNERWPGNDIKVHVFGSSGNLLCTNDSDVDICITTPFKTLEKTCLLAAVLAEHGMERVVCVPHAKVPIVKFWDPVLQLACDMNVNNTLALENTRMIKTYVEIDERVRPLAMIIKHWTKCRILNDAALGGTLSSYTWICMILNFLQTRNPPILPSLHKYTGSSPAKFDGPFKTFNDDLENLRGFGKDNHETLGELLFQFFRRYGHDVDYERNVISLREGRLISKEGKKWHFMLNNRLCVEEPFNIDRNLGNTADDISFRGIHLELRRAFDLVSEARLEQCMEAYEFPPVEERVWEKPVAKPPPVLSRSRSQSQSSRGSKNGSSSNRGGRQHSNSQSKSRRASSAAATNKYPIQQMGAHTYVDAPMMTPEQIAHAQYEQLKLHKQLFDEMQTLQRQEYELRLKQAQNQLQAEMHLQATHDSVANSHAHRYPGSSQIALTAPLRGTPQFPSFAYPQVPGTPQSNVQTQPSSPSLRAAQPDLRRGMHRSSNVDGPSSASIRSQSQPARVIPMNLAQQSIPPLPLSGQEHMINEALRRQQHQSSDQLYWALDGRGTLRYYDPNVMQDPRRQILQPHFNDVVPKEYAGYWISDSPPSGYHREDPRPSYVANGDAYGRVRGIPPSFGRLMEESRLPSPSSPLPLRDRSLSLQSSSHGLLRRQRFDRVLGTAPLARTAGPVIIDTTDPYPIVECPTMIESASHTTTASEATSGSDEQTHETPLTGELEPFMNGVSENYLPYDSTLPVLNEYLTSDRMRGARSEPMRQFESPLRQTSSSGIDPTAAATSMMQTSRNRGGLGIQFGEVDYTYSPARTDVNHPRDNKRMAATAARLETPTSMNPVSQNEQLAVPAPLLSPVREVRTPSPVQRRKEEMVKHVKSESNRRPVIDKLELRIPAFEELAKLREAKARQQLQLQQQLKSPTQQTVVTPEHEALEIRINGRSTVGRFSPGSTLIDATPVPHNTPISLDTRPSTTPSPGNGWQQQSSKKNKKTRSRPGSGQHPNEVAVDVERKGG